MAGPNPERERRGERIASVAAKWFGTVFLPRRDDPLGALQKQCDTLVDENRRLARLLEQRTAALQALGLREEEFRLSFENAAVGKAQADTGTMRIMRCNAAFATMLGYRVEDLVGRPAWELVWPEDLASDQIEIGRLLRGEIPVYIREKRYLRRDGSPVWGRVSGLVVPTSSNRRPGMMISVIEDIDEQYKARTALEQSALAMQQLASQRTAALEQRDVLLREVYHRVKNNLQLIDSFLAMQSRALKDAEARTALHSLRGRVHALGLVHHQLMATDDLATFDIAPFLRELVDNILESGATSGINMSITAKPLAVGLDLGIPLGLLVTELVTNAVKHAFPSGRGNIAVSFTHEGDEILLVVSDDGRGMAQARVAASSSTGLGTSILAGLVHQLNGTMTMRDENGTTVEIHIQNPVPA